MALLSAIFQFSVICPFLSALWAQWRATSLGYAWVVLLRCCCSVQFDCRAGAATRHSRSIVQLPGASRRLFGRHDTEAYEMKPSYSASSLSLTELGRGLTQSYRSARGTVQEGRKTKSKLVKCPFLSCLDDARGGATGVSGGGVSSGWRRRQQRVVPAPAELAQKALSSIWRLHRSTATLRHATLSSRDR